MVEATVRCYFVKYHLVKSRVNEALAVLQPPLSVWCLFELRNRQFRINKLHVTAVST